MFKHEEVLIIYFLKLQNKIIFKEVNSQKLCKKTVKKRTRKINIFDRQSDQVLVQNIKMLILTVFLKHGIVTFKN